MNQTTMVRIQEKGRVKIPEDACRRLCLKVGDRVAAVEFDHGVLLEPSQWIVSQALNAIGSALKDRGVNLEDWIQTGRRIRGRLIQTKKKLPATRA